MNHRNPFNKAYDPSSFLSGIDSSIGDKIIKKLSELVQVKVGDTIYPILYLDYQQLHLGDAHYLLTRFKHIEAQLLVGDKTERLSVNVTQDVWTAYFEIIHGHPESLLVLHSLLEPLWIGSRLDVIPQDANTLSAPTVLAGPKGSHITYYKSRDCVDYCRIGFSGRHHYKEITWTKKGILTRQHSLHAPFADEPSSEVQLMLEAALIILGMKEDQALLDLQHILEDLLVQAVFRRRHAAAYIAS